MARSRHRFLSWSLVPALAVAALGTCSLASAQGAPGFHLGIGGGAVFPVQDQSDVYKTGWNATLMLLWNFGDSPFGIRLDGSYGELETKDVLTPIFGNAKTKILDGTFDLVIGPHIGPYVQPYILGGVGAYDMRFNGENINTGNLFENRTTRFGWNAGAGMAFRLGSTTNTHFFVEGRYSSISISDLFTDSIHTGGRRFTTTTLNGGIIF
ncbi:MAG TPA: outer membrane beta-barrel protein [Thermoanaerobaculia bacterium]|jgi:opacity protein-like surface antigen|nr:outer membrane beta-barrel protein [Thermoanaerobaculia bacterium]